MRRPAPLLLGLLYYGALVVSWLGIQHTVLQLWTAGSASPAPVAPLDLALVLLVLGGVGRTLLAVLPAGEPGSHHPQELASTWAASHCLGVLALGSQFGGALQLGLELPLAVHLAPWAVLAALRLLLLPGALRPRHERVAQPQALHARLAWPAAALLLCMPLVVHWARGGPTLPAPALGSRALIEVCRLLGRNEPGALAAALSPWHWLAMGGLVVHGLWRAQRGSFGRRSVLMLLALAPLAMLSAAQGSAAVLGAMALACGSCFLIAWLRQADARARWLCALGYAAAAGSGPVGAWLALGGLLALVAGTPAPSRKRALQTALVALVLVAGPGCFEAAQQLRALEAAGWLSLTRAAADPHAWGFHWFLVWLSLVLVGLRWALLSGARRVAIADVDGGRELAALVGLLLFGFSVSALLPLGPAESWPLRLVPLLPLGALISGMVLLGAQRPASRLPRSARA